MDKLIKVLTELTKELRKNVNQSYSAQPNMIKDDAKSMNVPKPNIAIPEGGFGKVTVKDTNPQPAEPKKPGAYGKVILKEELACSANGQWYLNKGFADKKLSDKEVKVKSLQSQVDAGTYKPDASKIAAKMIDKKVLKNE